MKLPKATLALCVVTILVYLLVSQGEPYIYPLETIQLFGVAQDNILGAVSYFFMHIGFKHLIGNIISLLAMGAVLETKLKTKHVLGLYAATGIGAGIGYAILSPYTWIIGASAAISGIIAAAYIADVKKAAIVMLAALMITHFVVFPVIDNNLDSMQQWMEKQGIVLLGQVEVLEQNIQGIEEQIQLEQDPVRVQELVVVKETFQREIKGLQEQQKDTSLSETTLTQGRETEGAAPVSVMIHIMGMMIAVVYLVVFDRKIFKNLTGDLHELIKF